MRIVTLRAFLLWVGRMLRYRIGFKILMAFIADIRLCILKQARHLAPVLMVAGKAIARSHRAVDINLRSHEIIVA